jgi:hypothetical protein
MHREARPFHPKASSSSWRIPTTRRSGQVRSCRGRPGSCWCSRTSIHFRSWAEGRRRSVAELPLSNVTSLRFQGSRGSERRRVAEPPGDSLRPGRPSPAGHLPGLLGSPLSGGFPEARRRRCARCWPEQRPQSSPIIPGENTATRTTCRSFGRWRGSGKNSASALWVTSYVSDKSYPLHAAPPGEVRLFRAGTSNRSEARGPPP